MTYYSAPICSDELWHHGIKGMRWGVRRYENKDGSLTPLGKKRYEAYKESRRKYQKQVDEAQKLMDQSKSLRKIFKNAEEAVHDYKYRQDDGILADVNSDFVKEARKRGLDTSRFEKSVKDYDRHYYKNQSDIAGGRKYNSIKSMTDDEYKKWRNGKIKSGLKTTAKAAAVAAALYGRHKYKKWMKQQKPDLNSRRFKNKMKKIDKIIDTMGPEIVRKNK